MTDIAAEPAGEARDDLARAQLGDAGAFAAIVRTHQARVFSIALRLTGVRADAEEVAQDVFVQLHGTLAQIEGAGHLKHWLLRTVSHRAIDRLRQRGRRGVLVPIHAVEESPALQVGADGGDPLADAHLRRLLLRLAPDARAVVLLRFQEDLDPADIAQVLSMSINTVKSHLRRSLEWLRGQCGGEDHGP